MHRVLRLAALQMPIVAGFSVLPAFAAGNIGVTSAVQNQVEGVQGGSSSALAAGSHVFADEVIRTGAKSMAQLLFLDETSLQVGPHSEVKLDKFVYNPGGGGSVVFSATKGAFRFITGSQNPVNYEIKTPVASIGVRGTIADCKMDDNDGLTCTGQEGIVLIVVNGVTYALHPGETIFVSLNKEVTGPMAADDEFYRITGASPNPLFGGLLPGEHEQVDIPDDGTLRADELFPQEPSEGGY